MNKHCIATLKIRNRRGFVPAVLAFMDSIAANHKHHDYSRYNRMRFVVGEILKRRIDNAYPNGDGLLFVDLFIDGSCFELSIRDKGVPAWVDFSYDKTSVTESDDDFRNFVLDRYVDSVGVETLGRDGQRLYIRQSILNPLHFEAPAPYEPIEVLDTNLSVRAVETEQDALEAIRCIYSEYGYSYAYERMYYVDSLLQMIRDGELMSFLAVNEHGQTAGHFALTFSPLFPAMPEMSTVVTRREFRGMGLFGKFMEHGLAVAREKGFRAVMGQPVAFHPISQKAFLRAGFTATSLLLSYLAADTQSEYNKDAQRLDLCVSVKVIDPDAHSTIYPPQELVPFITKLYDRLGVSYQLGASAPAEGQSLLTMQDNTILHMKRLVVKEAGEDLERLLSDAVTDAIRKKHEMIELFLPLHAPCCEEAYRVAKNCRFVLSGAIPGGDGAEYLVMQILLKVDRRYDQLVMVGEFEELKQDIIALTADNKEGLL